MSYSRRQNLTDPYHLVGTVINGKYRLDAVLGIGGMGIVYLAYHLGINRKLALKVLKPDVAAADATVAEAFYREAKIAGSLAHPNIISVTDADTLPDGTPFMAMELLDSPTLEDELQQHKSFPLDRIERILSQICDALHYAHQSGIVHRDLKPANIALVGAGQPSEQVKILDLGIAKSLQDGVGKVSQAIGTPLYASPEQFIHGGDIDARSDLYSLAVILYRMLTGVLPFQGKTVGEIVSMHLTAPPPPLRVHAPELPESLEAFVIGALAKKPEGRPATALDFLAGFRAARQGRVVGETSVPLLGSGTELIAGVLDKSQPTSSSLRLPDTGDATGDITTARMSPTRSSGLSPTLPAAGKTADQPTATFAQPKTAQVISSLPTGGTASVEPSLSVRLGIPVWAAAVAAVVAVGLLLAVGVYVLKGNAAQSSQEKPVMATSEGPQTKGTSSVPSALRDRFDQVSRQVYQAVEPIVREGDDALLSSAVSVNPATIAAHYQRVEVAESQVAQAAAKWSSGTVPDLCPDEYKILGERYQQLRDALRNYGVSVRNLRNAYARTDFDMSQPLERFAETERSELGRDRMVLENTWRDTRQAESRFRDCTGL